MKKSLLLGAAVGAMIAAGAASPFVFAPERAATRDALDPLALNATLCKPDARSPFLSRKGFFIAAATAYAAPYDASEAGEAAPPPILAGLGRETMAITTASQAAEMYFEQGLRMMHAFNHGEARKSFVAAQKIDPACAMCFWGEAFTLGPNINAPMDPANNPAAVAAAQKAWTLAQADGVSALERALVQAMTYRYSQGAGPDERPKLDAAFADAMRDVADEFDANDEVQAMAVEAAMDTQPWDYWESDGITPKGRTAESLARLEKVLARNPAHAPSIHLYIHMTEASLDPWRAVEGADRLGALAPSAGHLVHMPSHTYYRIGRFKDSIAANIDAVAADEAYLAQAVAADIYRYGYYPHNIHFVLTSAQMGGDAKTALIMADKLDAALPMEMAAAAPWVQPIKAAPWLAKAQFSDPAILLAEPSPGDDIPYVAAAWRYARGEAFAKLGRVEEARGEAAAIAEISATADFTALIEGFVPANDLLKIMELTVLARAATAEGDHAAAIAAFQEAAEIQATVFYMEPPFWHYPVRRSLAGALLADGQAARAEHEFLKALVESPDDGWSYWGLAQARGAQGDRAGKRQAETLWKRAWLGDRRGLTVDRL